MNMAFGRRTTFFRCSWGVAPGYVEQRRSLKKTINSTVLCLGLRPQPARLIGE